MYSTSNHIWTEAQFEALRDVFASNTSTSDLLFWSSYADRHLHVAY
jgi:hypothetical protein